MSAPLILRWRGPARMSGAITMARPIAAIIGPKGDPGETPTVPDPGDLTLIFDNQLI